MNQAPSQRSVFIAVTFTLALLGLAAVVVWRAIQGPGAEVAGDQRRGAVEDSSGLPEGAENLTEEERQVLRDLLQRKGGERGR